MEVETDFLAEEWYDLLKKEVEPDFPGTEFYIYKPSKSRFALPWAQYADKIGVRIDDKEVFKNRLKGYPIVVNKSSVEDSLAGYVWKKTKKVMQVR